MLAGTLSAVLRALAGLARVRVLRTLSVVPETSPEPSAAVVEALYEVIRDLRVLAWQASLLHLQREALDAAPSGERVLAPAPSPPAYSREAVRTMVRRSPGGATSPEAVARAAERHVYAASRQTVAAAVTETSYTSLLEDAREFVGRLEDFPPQVRREIEAEVTRFAREYGEASQEEQDAALQAVVDRVSGARDALVASRVLTRDQEREVEQTAGEVAATAPSGDAVVPAEALTDPSHEYWRTDGSGRRIVRPFAFARVVQPSANGPCGFCAVLASRGPVYRSSYSAGLRADAFHNSCRCLVVPVYTSRRWVGKAEQAHYSRVYVEASRSGATGRDLINQIDRDLRSSRGSGEDEQ